MPAHGIRFAVGDRVELAPHLDLWMQGARYGEVVAVPRGEHGRPGIYVHVALDRLGGAVRMVPPLALTLLDTSIAP